MKKAKSEVAARAAGVVLNPQAEVKPGFSRVEILHDTFVGKNAVLAGQVLDVPEYDAAHLCMIAKAKPVA